MLTTPVLKTILREAHLLPEEEIRVAVRDAEKARISLETFLYTKHLLDEDTLYKSAADHYRVPFVDLRSLQLKKEALELVPNPLAVSRHVVAFAKEGSTIKLAMLDPTDLQTIEFISRKTGLEPKVYMTTPGGIREALKSHHETLETELALVAPKGEEDAKKLAKIAEDLPIVNIVNSIIEHAIFEDSSDIHIEPAEKEVSVRYRVDGNLRQVMTLPKAVQPGIVARVKILANLKIDEHMLPQDGRFTLQREGEDRYSFRVSIIPVYDGEKIVLRLLKEGARPLTLEELGILPGPRALIQSNIQKPHGIILVTGPTGSGKTTTLYSLLQLLNKPDINILTIEDPIEYHIAGVNQSQVNVKVGFSFANALRSFLRQDPDVLMVGEIRDQETAEIAIHAAMTGHLVLSTLHTNDAPTTIPRLFDMGIPPFLVAFTTVMVAAQRLVRKLCERCKVEAALEEKAMGELEKYVDFARIEKLLPTAYPDAPKDLMQKKTFYRSEGCRRCAEEGYKGRIGIYEVMEIDKAISGLINRRATAPELAAAAKEKGMLTLAEDGVVKAMLGMTSIEQVLEATRE